MECREESCFLQNVSVPKLLLTNVFYDNRFFNPYLYPLVGEETKKGNQVCSSSQMPIEIALFELFSVPSSYACARFTAKEEGRMSPWRPHQTVTQPTAMLGDRCHFWWVPQTWPPGACSSFSVWTNVPWKHGLPWEQKERVLYFCFLRQEDDVATWVMGA